ncbi:MAG: hypothetical protein DDT27_01282 [Dehalococcoidia bacterium]|nr:hypothetical protein [Chloroflexota bacterium]
MEQSHEEEGKKDGEDQGRTVCRKELQIFQGDEPDMPQLFHGFLFASGHNPEENSAED